MTTMTPPLNSADRAAAVRAAQGQTAPVQRMPMGIRVTKTPAAPAPAAAETTSATPATPRGVEDVLRIAAGSSAARTRQLAERIGRLVQELTGRVEAEEATRQEREAAEQRRRELAEAAEKLASQLAEVRQELRATGRSDSVDSPPRNRREGAAQRAAMRQWAVANGYEVKDRGRISREICEAYAAATQEVTR
ncbi:Lsr2 family DNA-binding protein [Micromonospora peucetia]|uniref:Lsr2 family DNA-binding protein n=1 Tax=Micromonospora peucetia TaxID=47871 RepID=UPI000A9BBA0B|nr:histone-like nucleoid-structuring protein Lsr2 [Micromonospora peucetia]